MTDSNKVVTRNVSLLVGPETLDLYHNEICQNIGALIKQAGTLKTAILELKKHLREHVGDNFNAKINSC